MVVLPKSDFETLDVLYVADNVALAEMYRLKLELDGYWVRVVDLDSAVAEVRARRPDIVFLELPAGRPHRRSSSRRRAVRSSEARARFYALPITSSGSRRRMPNR